MNKNKNISNFYCPDIKDFVDYLNNRLDKKQVRIIEEHIIDCQACSDIVEGLQSLDKPEDIFNIKSGIDKKIDKKTNQKRFVGLIFQSKYRSIAAVALIFVVFGVALFINRVSKNDFTIKQDEIAMTDHDRKPSYEPTKERTIVEEEIHDDISEPISLKDKHESSEITGEVFEDKFAESTKPEDLDTYITDEEEEESIEAFEELLIVDDADDIDTRYDIDAEAGQSQRASAKISSFVAEPEEEYGDPIDFAVVEQKPTFPGGDTALINFITENTVYPEIAKEKEIQGRVFVSFIIDTAGKVTNVALARGVDPYLDNEALRVVKLLPDWTPGKQRGKPVNVYFIVPINFRLD